LIDFGTVQKLLPQCSEVLQSNIPILFYPIRLIQSFGYVGGHSLFGLKIWGVLFYILIAIGLYWFVRLSLAKNSENEISKHFGPFLISIGYLSIGVAPFYYSLNRPQQFVVLSCIGLGVTPLITRFIRGKWLGIWFLALVYVLFTSHPTSLLLAIIPISVAWVSFKNRLQKQVYIFITIVLALSSFYLSSKIFSCPDDDFFTYLLSYQYLPASWLVSSPIHFFKLAFLSFIELPVYFINLLFELRHTSDVIPGVYEMSLFELLLNRFIILVFILFTLSTIYQTYKSKSLIATSSLLSVLIFSGVNRAKLGYETPLILILVFVSFISANTIEGSGFRKRFEFWSILFILSGLLSTVATGIRYQSHLFESWADTRINNNETHLVSPRSLPAYSQDIEKAKSECQISNDSDSYLLGVDDLTYFYFSRSKSPFLVQYIGGYYGQRISDPERLLVSRKSSGIVSRCTSIPKNFISDFKKFGEICCLNLK